MRVWTIALLSSIAGVAAAAILAAPALRGAASSEIVSLLLPQSPALAVAALAGYALAALLLTTGSLVGDMTALRGRLARLAEHGAPAQDDIARAFAPSRLARLARPLAPTSGMAAAPDGVAWTPKIVRRGEVRAEISRLHYIWLARGQFFTALVLLAAFAAIGFVQDYSAPLISLPGMIPTIWACAALGGLILIGGLSALAIDVTVEPVVEDIVRMTGERLETRLLRRMTELVEEGRTAASTSALGQSEALPMPRRVSDELLERLATAVEEGRRAWLDSVADLSGAAAALRATMSASAESLEASLHAALERIASTAQSSTNPGAFDAANFVELQAAVERLTAAIERVGRPAGEPASTAPTAKSAPRRGGGAADGLAAELATLLREINAKP